MIPGGPDLHVKQGSSLRLECQLIASTEAPSFIFWYREGRMINYDDEPGVKVEATKNGSILVVDKVKLSHGANYTCWPSNARPAYIMIHVIEGWLSIFFSFLYISFLFLSRIQDLCTYTYAHISRLQNLSFQKYFSFGSFNFTTFNFRHNLFAYCLF